MNRRSFLSLCGLAAGSCLIPDVVARLIRETCVLAEDPYLVLPRNPSSVLYALTSDGKTDFMLHYGDPFAASKPPTWAQYFDEFEGFKFQDKRAVREWWIEQVGDLEDDPITIKADESIDGVALEKWENRQEMYEGPAALAYRMLEDICLWTMGEGRSAANASAVCASSKATAQDPTSPMSRPPIWRPWPVSRTG